MSSLLIYLTGLLIAVIAINVLLVRTIRAEQRRDRENRQAGKAVPRRSSRHGRPSLPDGVEDPIQDIRES